MVEELRRLEHGVVYSPGHPSVAVGRVSQARPRQSVALAARCFRCDRPDDL